MFKIKSSFLVGFILLLPIFQPIYLEVVLSPAKIYPLLALVCLAYVVYEVIAKRKKISGITIVIMIYACVLVISTIMGDGYFNQAFIYAVRISLLVLIFEIFANKVGILLKCLMLHSEICVYLNFLTILIAPEGFLSRSNSAYGMTEEWFLGADNAFAMWLVPALIIAWIYSEYYKSKVRCLLLTIVILTTEIIKGSATGIVGVVLFLILISFPYVKHILTPIKGMIVAFTAFVIIVLIRNVDFMEPIMEFFGKDMTFTGRMVIWENAVEAIKERPVLGHGVLINDEMVSYLGRTDLGIAEGSTHCHCQFLQMAFQGGFIAVILLVLIYIFVIKESRMKWGIRVTRYGLYGLIVYTVMGIVEVLENPLMLLLFPLCYWVAKTADDKEKYIDKRGVKIIWNRVGGIRSDRNT